MSTTKTKVRTHFAWSIESPDDGCPVCGTKTVLLIAPLYWSVDCEDREEDDDVDAEVTEEVTGHYCRKCQRLCSLSLNT